VSLDPKVQLSELRRIGWREWDPIGLRDGSKFGPDGCEDEYDQYLLHVVSLLTRGGMRSEATAYLEDVAADRMSLGFRVPERAKQTVDAIAGYLKELPDSPPIAD
jgi:hypothetical protein